MGRYVRFEDFKRWTTSFSAMAGHTLRQLAIGTGENAREMNVGVVSYSFFEFCDAPPALGRYFTAREDTTPAGYRQPSAGATCFKSDSMQCAQ